jgi:F0F1-type ATP synthase membrane subunit b/b'
MPETNLDVIYRYIAGAVAIVGSYAALVHAWYNSRFKVVNKRIDKVAEEVKENSTKVSEHEATISAFEVHIENGSKERTEIKESIRDLHGKMDKLIERT